MPKDTSAKSQGRSPKVSTDKLREIIGKKYYELYEKRGR
jgi:hypothetical protein